MVYGKLKRDVLKLFQKRKFYEIFVAINSAKDNEDVRNKSKFLIKDLLSLLNDTEKKHFLDTFQDFAEKNSNEDLSFMGLYIKPKVEEQIIDLDDFL